MKPIERQTRRFNPLQIPKSIKANLPFKAQITQAKPQRKQTYMQSRAVVLDKSEKQARDILQTLAVIKREKDTKRKAKAEEKRKVYKKKLEAGAEMKAAREKREKDEYWRTEGKKRRNVDGGDGGARKRGKK